jgi:ABC-type Fe3+ transport system substrate-binding protein
MKDITIMRVDKNDIDNNDDLLNHILSRSLKDLVHSSPSIRQVFKSYGLQEIENPDIFEKIGSVLKLSTFLRHRKIDKDEFLKRFQQTFASGTDGDYQDNLLVGNPTLLALLPCGLKSGINGALEKFAEKQQLKNTPFTYRAEANVNHELSFYTYIDSIQSENELPDVIVSSDLNSFLHRQFITRFVNTGLFVNKQSKIHSTLEATQYADPKNNYTMFAANPLVMVHVRDTTSPVPTPVSWKDILCSRFRKKVVIRGQDNFFCSAVLLPFYRLFGMDAVLSLAESVVDGMHPSQMVKQIDSAQTDIAPIYIMPLFFAKKIKRTDRIEIIFPHEGVFISPITLLRKKLPSGNISEITDFLLGLELQQYCADNFFLSVHPDIKNPIMPNNKLYWIGWDFIYNNDLLSIKNTLGSKFTSTFMAGRI